MTGEVSPEEQAAAAAADAAALARVDKGGILEGPEDEPTPDPNARPEWCAEKYARHNADGTFNASLSAAEMAKGMEHLNKMATQANQNKAKVDEEPKDDDAPKGDELELEPLTSPEFWNSLTEEYNTDGDLSAESRKIIEDMGIPSQMIDDYIEGQKARGGQYHEKVTSVLGAEGSDQYNRLVDWAGDNMDEAQAKVFNDAVTSGDITRAQMAIRDLKMQYVKAEGSTEGLLLGGSSGGRGAAAQPFASRYEQTEAINSPRYAKDEAYRKNVEARMMVTNL